MTTPRAFPAVDTIMQVAPNAPWLRLAARYLVPAGGASDPIRLLAKLPHLVHNVLASYIFACVGVLVDKDGGIKHESPSYAPTFLPSGECNSFGETELITHWFVTMENSIVPGDVFFLVGGRRPWYEFLKNQLQPLVLRLAHRGASLRLVSCRDSDHPALANTAYQQVMAAAAGAGDAALTAMRDVADVTIVQCSATGCLFAYHGFANGQTHLVQLEKYKNPRSFGNVGDAVLTEAGLDRDTIARLRASGAAA